ncbi:MAG: ATP-binding protein [Bacteroidota bacterium]
MESLDHIKKILHRERQARKVAEQIIEQKALELYLINQKLTKLNESLEFKVKERTWEIEQSKEDLQRAKERAEEATRAKSQFLSNMSHEIRTPLNAIIGLTDLMTKEYTDPSLLEFIQSIKFSADNLLGIVGEILDFSKIESGEVIFERICFSPRKVCNALYQTFRHLSDKKGIKLEVECNEDVPDFLWGDKTKLNQILNNLLNNSIKFTDKGAIRLSIFIEQQNGDQYWLMFCVEDSGVGIPEDKYNTIFESFRQANSSTTREYGGTGLGLTITRKLIELQGGSIAVQSEVGVGTTFSVLLPFEKAEAPMTTLHTITSKQVPIMKNKEETLSQMRVLVVEDMKMNQFLMRQIFKRKKISVDIASNGKEAIELLEKQEYDIVFMDLHMPVMDGRDATRMIRDPQSQVLNHEIPIIGLSADAFNKTRDELLQLGMDDFLTKPVEVQDVYDKLTQVQMEKEAQIGND